MEKLAFILLSLVILLLMVLIHEAGHYTAAKILGFTVDEFAVGFGPKLFSKRRKNGELFSVRILPLGGFCAFYGETDDGDAKTEKPKTESNADTEAVDEKSADAMSDAGSINTDKTDVSAATEVVCDETSDAGGVSPAPSESDDLLTFVMKSKLEECDAKSKAEKRAEEPAAPPRLDKNGNPALPFNKQKPWKRIIVLLGGVLFNFLSAIIFSLIYIWVVGFATPQVAEIYVDTNGLPYCPELRVGDVILAVDGEDISVMRSFDDLVGNIGKDKTVTLKISRDGKVMYEKVTRRAIATEIDGEPTEYVGFGFRSKTVFRGNNAGNAFKYCVPYTGKLSWSILGAFGGILTGKQSITSMSGPVGSISMMAEVSAADWRNILILLPLLASNLAIFNLLPFPALDGAHVVFTVIEWIRRKPINRKVESMIHFVGMVVLLLFVCIVDIISFAT